MPYFLAGLRISGGLALIGAVVAEFVAGTGGTSSGLAYRILESGYQLRIPRMFAALLLISAVGYRAVPCAQSAFAPVSPALARECLRSGGLTPTVAGVWLELTRYPQRSGR